jgi:hypothetical protein
MPECAAAAAHHHKMALYRASKCERFEFRDGMPEDDEYVAACVAAHVPIQPRHDRYDFAARTVLLTTAIAILGYSVVVAIHVTMGW